MEIKVIGIGPGVQDEVKNIEAAFKKIMGVETKKDDPQPEDALIDLIKKSMLGIDDLGQFKLAKKKLKKAITSMRDDGISPDNAAVALSEVTCIFFNGMLKPVEGKTGKEAFLDYIGTVYDAVDEKVKEVRAKREEACCGR